MLENKNRGETNALWFLLDGCGASALGRILLLLDDNILQATKNTKTV